MTVNGRFVDDVTIPDNTPILAGTSFVKTWQVQNNGDVTWGAGYQLVFVDGTQMATVSSTSLPPCKPGEQGQVSITMIAPATPGTYKSTWRFRDDQGNLFGNSMWVLIVSKAATNPAGQNKNYFVADVTIPDNMQFQPGQTFVKTWRIRNTGTLPWNDHYSLTQVGGDLTPQSSSISVPPVAAGSEVNLSVTFTAPTTPGSHYADWQMKDDKGQLFGVKFWVKIVVPGATPAGGTTGSGSTIPAGSIQANAPHYSQRDPLWGSVVLGVNPDGITISRWGCMMTCFAMTASYMGHTVNPKDLNTLMIQKGGYSGGYLTRWNALQVVFGDIFYDGMMDQGATLLAKIDSSLQAGRPVPVQVDITPSTAYSDNDQHWVLVVGKNGNDYVINDPINYTGASSLMQKYGRSDGQLVDAVRKAIFYHR